jgi:glycosyltransferase involved in cell wall biosynthesis
MAQARTLIGAGWEVAVVCPGSGPAFERLEGIEVHRFPLEEARSAAGYLREYAQAMRAIRRLAREVSRQGRFDVVQVANPPDFLHRAVRGPRSEGAGLVFDHRDLAPELFRSRYGSGGPIHVMLLALERRAIRSADAVLATNESYRRLAIARGGADPADVFVVRNGPDLNRFRPVPPEPARRRGRRFLLAWVGVMGRQDGVDHALAALSTLRAVRGEDWHAVFAGDGEVRERMVEFAGELGISHLVEFPGWQDEREVRRWLSSADVCLAPDPPSPLNDLSTMAKVPEYMAMGKPTASYDLAETRVSAGPAASYAISPDPPALADCINRLLDDPEMRRRMGELARERVAQLSWEHSARAFLDAYEHACGRSVAARTATREPALRPTTGVR